MEGSLLAILSALIIAFALIARRAERAHISAPMAFLVAGALVFTWVSDVSVTDHQLRTIAEVALVVILFHDASSVRLNSLRHHPGLPIRLLAIGFPIALISTFGTVDLLLPTIGVAGALLIAAAVTPTDAGLGAATVLNPTVPRGVRRALNVESGLNDGLATPIALFALSMLATDEGVETPPILSISVVPISLAIAWSLILGVVAAWLLDRSRHGRLSSQGGRAMVVLALPLLLWGGAEVIGANGFIAAFVGGMTFGARSTCLHEEDEASEFLELGADLLSYAVWFLAGGLVVKVLSDGYDWQWLLVAVLALTVLRVLPVALALIGSGLGRPTVWFIGWFGPRGLATIVFALLAAEELAPDSPELSAVLGVCVTTVVLSVFAHGMTARPLADRFGRWARSHPLAEPGEAHLGRPRGRPLGHGRGSGTQPPTLEG